jgi:hypothetical protein
MDKKKKEKTSLSSMSLGANMNQQQKWHLFILRLICMQFFQLNSSEDFCWSRFAVALTVSEIWLEGDSDPFYIYHTEALKANGSVNEFGSVLSQMNKLLCNTLQIFINVMIIRYFFELIFSSFYQVIYWHLVSIPQKISAEADLL